MRSQQLTNTTEIEFYRPFPQRSTTFLAIAVRTATKPEATANIVRAALGRVDKTLPIIQPNTMEGIIADSLGQQRLTMSLLGGFAAIALVLAVVGIYGASLTRSSNAPARSVSAWRSARRQPTCSAWC